MSLANFGTGEPAIDYIAPGLLGSHSGGVVLFADSDAMVAGDALTSTNLNLILNAFYAPSVVPEPSSGVMMLLGSGGAGLATYLKRRKRPVLA